MNEWTDEEIEIISLCKSSGKNYYDAQKELQSRGFNRTYESIKKVASLRKIGSGTERKDSIPESFSYSNPAVVDRTEELSRPPVHNNLKPRRVLAIGDIHSPFEHRYYLDFLVETYQKWNCDTVVCMGDEADFHAFSKYTTDPNGHSPGRELELAVEHLKPYYEAFPVVQVCTSNHTIRPLKKGFEFGLPRELFKSYREFLQAPEGWTWHNSIEIDGVLYHHGEGYSGALGHHKAALNAMKSTVIGHIHSHGGVAYIQTEFKRIFGLQTGCGVDIEAYAFAYGKNCAFKPTLGCGVILEGKEAYFIPMSGY